MSTAGTVTIDFAAETARFTAELKKVRSQLSDLQKTTATVSRGFQSAGKLIVGALAGVSIGTAIRSVVRATAEAEESAAKLENALQSSGVSAELSAEQLKTFASELQRTTTFSDEAVQDVESLLLSFRGLSGDTILKATSAVLDLSTRMGVDLRSAAIQVGKALSDPEKGLTALARAGVKFSESQQNNIKQLAETGQLAKAQAIILKELEARFGGAAEAARNTFGGALTGVKNAFDDLLEAKSGMPGATSALNQLARTLNSPEVKQGMDNLIGGISKLIELSAIAAAKLPGLADSIGVFAVAANNIKVFENAGARMRAELNFELKELERMHDLSIIFTDEEIKKQEQYIATLRERIRLADEIDKRNRQPIAPVVTTPRKVDVAAQPAELDFDLRLKQQEARLKLTSAQIATMAGELEAFDRARTEIEERIAKSRDGISKANENLLENRIRTNIDLFDSEVNAVIDAEQRKFDVIADFEQQKLALQQGTFAAGVGLLQALSTRSKTAAKALIILNRGIAITQVIQNTIAAAAKALAIYGPTPQGYAAAAAVKAWGAVQVGLLAATGAIEISNVNAGNAGGVGGSNLGTPANPIPVTPSEGAQQGRVVQVVINGNIAGPEASRWLVDAISDLINGNDTIIINGNSRQAAEIRGD